MSEKDFFEDYGFRFHNFPPLCDEMDMLMEDLRKYPDSQKGWEIFKEIFELNLSQGRFHAENCLPDPLSFSFFRDRYGDHPGMEDVVRRYYAVLHPIGKDESLPSAERLAVYLSIRPDDMYAWDRFVELFKALTEEEQKNIANELREFMDGDTNQIITWLLNGHPFESEF